MQQPPESFIIFRVPGLRSGTEEILLTGIFQFLIRLDHTVFRGINWLAGRNAVLDWLARVGADDHIIPVLLTLLVLLVIVRARDRRGRELAFACLVCAVLAVVLSMVVLFALNSAFFRPRPFTSQHVRLLFYHNTDSAFPSNAATLSFALAFAVLLFDRRVGAVMVGLACYLGLSRVLVGIHYPLDVISGALLGLSGALLARAAEPAYRPLARSLGGLSDRLLASWKKAPMPRVRGGAGR